MSNTEYHYGQLIPVDLQRKTFEETARIRWGKELPEIYKTYLECLLNERDYIYSNEVLYEIVDHAVGEEDVFNLIPSGEGFIFSGSFYNGGTCLEEMLEEKLREHGENNL